jgi:hypothetical protein
MQSQATKTNSKIIVDNKKKIFVWIRIYSK